MHELFEHGFWQNWSKFYNKMVLPIQIRIIYKENYCYAILLKFGDKFLASLTKYVLETKASICFIIKENVLLYCGYLLAFAVAAII